MGRTAFPPAPPALGQGGQLQVVAAGLCSAACGRTLEGGINGVAISHIPSGTSQLHSPRPLLNSILLAGMEGRKRCGHRRLRPPVARFL